MKTAERNELKKIVTQRFALLREQVAQRENEVMGEVKAQIEAHHADAIREAKEEVVALNQELVTLEQRYRDLLTRYDARGVQPPSGGFRRDRDHFDGNFEPSGMGRRVQTVMQQLRAGAGSQRLNLRGTELDLLESIALDVIESDEAKEFLARIPTVEALMPLSDGKVQAALETTLAQPSSGEDEDADD